MTQPLCPLFHEPCKKDDCEWYGAPDGLRHPTGLPITKQCDIKNIRDMLVRLSMETGRVSTAVNEMNNGQEERQFTIISHLLHAPRQAAANALEMAKRRLQLEHNSVDNQSGRD